MSNNCTTACANKLKHLLYTHSKRITEHHNTNQELFALSYSRRQSAPHQLILCIHFDTVFAKECCFQHFKQQPNHSAMGPGVIDAKGGLVILLSILKALDTFEAFEQLGYSVILNCDEERGSPYSSQLIYNVLYQF